MRSAYLIVRYEPRTGKRQIGIYSEQNLSFCGHMPIDITIYKADGQTFEEARDKVAIYLMKRLRFDIHHQSPNQLKHY